METKEDMMDRMVEREIRWLLYGEPEFNRRRMKMPSKQLKTSKEAISTVKCWFCKDKIPKDKVKYLKTKKVCKTCWNNKKERQLGEVGVSKYKKEPTWLDELYEKQKETK